MTHPLPQGGTDTETHPLPQGGTDRETHPATAGGTDRETHPLPRGGTDKTGQGQALQFCKEQRYSRRLVPLLVTCRYLKRCWRPASTACASTCRTVRRKRKRRTSNACAPRRKK